RPSLTLSESALCQIYGRENGPGLPGLRSALGICPGEKPQQAVSVHLKGKSPPALYGDMRQSRCSQCSQDVTCLLGYPVFGAVLFLRCHLLPKKTGLFINVVNKRLFSGFVRGRVYFFKG
uniref:Uncharacterized protein n=1 Tax=Strigops habroptila TaxID=2489341 RepID=A0A672U6C5_STRHB